MGHWLTNRTVLKDACGIPATATGDHDQLDAVIETVSHEIEDYLGYPVGPHERTRYLTPRETSRLRLDQPLVAVTTLRTDAQGDASYESTWSTAMYHLAPYDATGDSPPAPYWEIEARATSTSVFPAGINRGVELAGTWGLYDQRKSTTAILGTSGPNSTQLTLEVRGASSLHPGQTLRIDSEQIFVQERASSGATGSLTVLRGQNGSPAASHAALAAITYYGYPIVERAALYQAQREFIAKDTPMTAMGGLHPFVRHMLDRTPRVG